MRTRQRQTWFSLMMETATLAVEAQQVMALRLTRLAAGGAAAQTEAARMVSEKVVAYAEASTMLARGKSPETVMRRYRTRVRANSRRLTAPRATSTYHPQKKTAPVDDRRRNNLSEPSRYAAASCFGGRSASSCA